jgi:hypothetical protein
MDLIYYVIEQTGENSEVNLYGLYELPNMGHGQLRAGMSDLLSNQCFI